MGHALLKRGQYSAREYLAMERDAPFKSEFINGMIYPMVELDWDSNGSITMMAGASSTHGTLVSNANIILGGQLMGKPCGTWTQDLRVKVPETELYTYPDLIVACPPHKWDDAHEDTLENPKVLIEVLSPTTAEYDRNAKWAHYQKIASLTDYLLVEQDWVRVEHFSRETEVKWQGRIYESMDDVIQLTSVGCTLSLNQLYARVELTRPK